MVKNAKRLLCLALLFALLPAAAWATTPRFNDIQGHWARDYILAFAAKDLVHGYPDGSFRPDRPVSRAEFICILLNCLGITPAPGAQTSAFSDTANHWARAQIAEAVLRGILVPGEYPDGLKPNGPLYRSEVAAMMVRALGKKPTTTPTTFKDNAQVEKSMYKGYIKTACDEGLMHGYPDGTFRPFQGVTRGEACAMLTNFLGKLGTPSAPPAATNPSSGGSLTTLIIKGNRYTLGNTAVYLKRDMTNIPISSLSVVGGLLFINNTYTYPLNGTVNNPDLVVNNVRYVNCRLSAAGGEVTAEPDAVVVDSFTYDGRKYYADYVKLYIGNKNGDYYLSDAAVNDEHTIRVAGNDYDLATIPVAIALGEDFYAVTKIYYDGDNISLDLVPTAPVVRKGLDLSDISAIFIDNRSISLDNVSSLFFIINGTAYDLGEAVVDASGSFTADGKNYPPDQVTVVLNKSFYKLKDARNMDGKFVFYCTSSPISVWAKVNGKYQDAGAIQIFVGSNTYDLKDVLVVQRNVIRVGGRQYKLRDVAGCRIDGKFYDLEEIDYDTNLDLVTLEVSESSGTWIGGLTNRPQRYVFYLDNTLYRDGAGEDTAIYAAGDWRALDLITLADPSHFVYNNTTYDLIGAQIKIGDTTFKVTDAAWRVGTQTLEVYLQAP
ncbi:MAG: hypothetical protein PWR22_1223 [Moorella sp. (in: firmicutes)]|nr:hypothetical protein [Moorella sp. (in: firmicutes)]